MRVSIPFQRLVLKLAVLVVFIAESGCESSVQDSIETLNRGINAEPGSLDPHQYSGSDAASVLRDIGEGLLSLDSQGRVVEGMAREWRVSPDGTIYDFELRPGLTWSNGDVLSPDDIVLSFRRLVDPSTASPNAHIASNIKNAAAIVSGKLAPEMLGVRSLSSTSVQIELAHPASYFPQLLTHPAMQPRYGGSGADSGDAKDNRVSNGAYSIESILLGASITLRKNERYWDRQHVQIPRVTYHVVGQDVEPVRFTAGELDITDNVSEYYFERFKSTQPQLLQVSPMLGIYYYGLNLKNAGINRSLALRRALYLAIDREIIVSRILGRGEIPAYTFVPPGVANYPEHENIGVSSQKERENEARRLVAEASGVGPLPILELRYNTGGGHERIAIAVADMWQRVLGLEVQLRSEELKVFLENARAAKDTQIIRLSWTGDYDDAYTFLQVFESNSGANMVGYENAKFDELLQIANAQSDGETRQKLMKTAESMLLADMPAIPVYYYVSKHLVSSRVEGWRSNLLDVHQSKHLSLSE